MARKVLARVHRAAVAMPPLAGMERWSAQIVWELNPAVVTWRLVGPGGEARYLKVGARGQELGLAAERDRLAWAAGRLPVPRVLAYGEDAEREWLLTAALPGANAIDERLREDPERLVPLLGGALRAFHAAPAGDCPFDARLDVAVETARRRVIDGLVDVERELRAEHGALTAETALARLDSLRPPDEDAVVCHGDFCLPNVLIDRWRLGGFVDLGKLGLADRWADLAVATWSVTWNLGPGWEDTFLEAYGVRRDARKIAFYRLLYDLLP